MNKPYLPYTGALGECAEQRKSIYMYEKGAEGIMTSPRSRHERIVTEALPSLSHDLDDMPIRCFYSTGHRRPERDVGFFIELARTYQRAKDHAPYPLLRA